MDKLDKIFIINLDRSRDRLIDCVNKIKNSNLPMNKVSKFKAVDGNNLMQETGVTHELLSLFLNSDLYFYKNTNNLIATALSHYFIYKLIIADNYKNTIILEDDNIFKKDLNIDLDNLLNNIPEDADIVFIGRNKEAVGRHVVPWDINGEYSYETYIKSSVNDYVGITKDNDNPGAIGYIITLQGAKNIVKHVEENGFNRAIDWVINDYLRENNKLYISKKILCTSDIRFESDIRKD